MIGLRLLGLAIAGAVAVAGWVLTCAAWRADRVIEGAVPLDPREFRGLTVVTAGTGGAAENPDRLGPATAIGFGSRLALVDAGRGVAEALRKARIPPSQPDTVYLTSLLPENTVGLDDLLLTGWLAGRRRALRVVGPEGVGELARALETAHRGSVEVGSAARALPVSGASFEVLEVADGFSEERDGLLARAAAMDGGPGAALAWRFEAGGRSAVVAGMGWAPDALARFARGAGLLVHEAAYVPTPDVAAGLGLDVDPERLRRDARLHTQLGDVGELARRAGVETLALVRLVPPPVYDFQITAVVGETFDGRIVVPDDGEELTP